MLQGGVSVRLPGEREGEPAWSVLNFCLLCQCRSCHLPLCGPECEGGPHHAPECEQLSKAQPPISVSDQDSFHPVYSTIAPLRLLAVKEARPEVWRMVERLMDHLEQRRQESSRWEFVRLRTLPLIREQCGLQCPPELVERIIGIFRTNSVKWEARLGETWRPVGHALCPLFSVLCHSCVNNTRYTQTKEGRLVVRAVKPIKAGEEITTQYRGPNTGNVLRRPEFPSNWMFECRCERCEDPTELGTHASTLRCVECDQPSLYPRDSEQDSDWLCRACNYQESAQSVTLKTRLLEADLDSFPYSASPEEWEDLLERFQSVLHENHYICMKTKRILLQIYGAREGYKLNQLSRKQLERKISLCRNYISIFSVLEPGHRTWKGAVLEELLGPLTIILHQDQQEGKMNKIEYLLKYKEIINMLKEASKCRQFDERDKENDGIIGKFYQSMMTPLQTVAQE